MSVERSLSERIADTSEEGPYRLGVDSRKAVESVLNHLRKMLNTRQGSAPAAPDYGLPDFNDVARDLLNPAVEVGKAIRLCIEKYEPRLSRVQVRQVEDPEELLTFRFEVTARLELEDDEAPVWLETTMESGGKIRVRG
jgi:type VI secretion system protein